jgi:hypothetical protein
MAYCLDEVRASDFITQIKHVAVHKNIFKTISYTKQIVGLLEPSGNYVYHML